MNICPAHADYLQGKNARNCFIQASLSIEALKFYMLYSVIIL